jgi:DNA-binding MarR family transcriptional regulator
LKDNSATILTEIWNELLLSKSIEVCTEKLQGIGLLEMKVLKMIYFNPEYKIKDFIDQLGIPNSTLTNVINRLVKKDLVNRKIDHTDLRSFGLELTSNGKEAIQEHLTAETSIFEGVLSRLDKDERDEFVKVMRKIADGVINTH